MITREIIQRIQVLYSKGTPSDDTRLSNRLIYSKLVSVRSRLISQLAKDKKKINQWNFQTLPCVELILAPIHECPCVPSDTCKILRSKWKIPKILTDLNRHLIQSVTSLDGSIQFSETTWKEVKYQSGNKYAKTMPQYYFKDEYLYIVNNKEIEVITMTALFSDPSEPMLFPSYCTTEVEQDCTSPLDKEFPMDNELIDGLIQIANNELVIMFSQMNADNLNSASDDATMQLQTRRLPRS